MRKNSLISRMAALLLSAFLGVILITRSAPQSYDYRQNSADTMVYTLDIGIPASLYGGSNPDIIPDFPLPPPPIQL